MNSRTDKLPYRSTGYPEFDIGSLRAKVDSYRIERSACVRDGAYADGVRLLIHATVLDPERFQRAQLEVVLLRSDEPNLVNTLDQNHLGVGIFKFYADFEADDIQEQLEHGFFSIRSAFKAMSFEDAVNMLLKGVAMSESLEIDCRVAGLHTDCAWNLIGTLCVTDISLVLNGSVNGVKVCE